MSERLIELDDGTVTILCRDEPDGRSTGNIVWGCARVTADFLKGLGDGISGTCTGSDLEAKKSFWRGKKVLELGSGTGYLGILTAALGTLVILVAKTKLEQDGTS